MASRDSGSVSSPSSVTAGVTGASTSEVLSISSPWTDSPKISLAVSAGVGSAFSEVDGDGSGSVSAGTSSADADSVVIFVD